MRGMYGTPAPTSRQAVVNQSWPPREVALRLTDRADAIAVRARVELEVDGEDWIDGTAKRWYGRSVCVYAEDSRLLAPYTWLDADDVVRR